MAEPPAPERYQLAGLSLVFLFSFVASPMPVAGVMPSIGGAVLLFVGWYVWRTVTLFLPAPGYTPCTLEDWLGGWWALLDEVAKYSPLYILTFTLGSSFFLPFFFVFGGTQHSWLLFIVDNAWKGTLILGLAWLIHQQAWRRARFAGPGRFTFSAWPCVPGDPIEVAFKQRLQLGDEPVHATARLERVWVVGPGIAHNGLLVWYRIEGVDAFELGDGDVRRTPDGLTAGWRVQVPHLRALSVAYPESPPFYMSTGGRNLEMQGKAWLRWRLVIDVTAAGHDPVRSQIVLRVAQDDL